jgi:ABC-type uncharacterized transport system permease subunit
LGLALAGGLLGSVLFRLLVAIALRAGLNPVDLKLITALFVFVALVFPSGLAQVKGLWRRRPVGNPKPLLVPQPASATAVEPILR